MEAKLNSAPALNVRDPAQLTQIAMQLIEVNKELETRALRLEGKVIEECARADKAEDNLHIVSEKANAMQPAVAALDRIANADGAMCITDAAKMLQVLRKDLIDWLMQNGWVYRRLGNSHLVGYHQHTTNGDLEHKVTTVLRPDGTEKVTEQVRITPQGLTKLAKRVPDAKSPQQRLLM